MHKLTAPKIIAITGASSGIGAALARHYAAAGVYLLLNGRDEKRLEAVAAECRARGAQVEPALIDILDRDALKDWLVDADARMPIDLLIANAGISAGSGGGGLMSGETAEQARRIFAVNVEGVINTVTPLLPRMRARGHGQIALMASIAGFRGLPSAPAYSASKAAVRVYGDSLRGLAGKHGVHIAVICPGYIRTPMTARNPFWMPFIISPERAAEIIAQGLAKNRACIAFPRVMAWPLHLLGCLPVAWTDPLFSRLPAKPSLG